MQEIFILFSRCLNYRRLIIKSGYKFFKETFFKWLGKQLQCILSRFCFSIIYIIKWLSLFNSSVKYLQHEQFHQPASKNTFIYWWLFCVTVIEIWKQIMYSYNLWLIHSSLQNICVIFVYMIKMYIWPMFVNPSIFLYLCHNELWLVCSWLYVWFL